MDSSFVGSLLNKYHVKCGYQLRFIDLVSEVGELGKSILNATSYGKGDYHLTTEVQMELGDCLFSLLALCAELDIDSEQAINLAIEKYEKRFGNTGRISSDAR